MEKQDGLSQLLSSYGSGQSEGPGSDNEAEEMKDDNKGESADWESEITNKLKRAGDGDEKINSREILPLPEGVLNMFNKDAEPEEDTSQHDGRTRAFSHFPGNWAMHVFIPFKTTVHFESLVTSLVESLSATASSDVHVMHYNELHVSVSRTVPIRHYWIEPIVQQLRSGLRNVPRFMSVLQYPEIYTNDEKTRSFVALRIMAESKNFQGIVDVVDSIFGEFSLPAFYKDPSFHVSVAWFLGDLCSDRAEKIRTKLQDVFDAHVYEEEIARSLVFEVKEVHCKIGNKQFLFHLGGT